MSAQKHVWIRCNAPGCETGFGMPGDSTDGPFASARECRVRAKREGWTKRGGRDFCPACTHVRRTRFHLDRLGRRRLGSRPRPRKRKIAHTASLML